MEQDLSQPRPQGSQFCSQCGTSITAGAMFCTHCGANTRPADPSQQPQPQQPQPQYQQQPQFQQPQNAAQFPQGTPVSPVYAAAYAAPKSGLPVIVIVLIAVFTISIIGVGAFFLIRFFMNSNPGTPTGTINTAVVSAGVKTTDLGNILNGQYYFATDQYIFYSSYDTNEQAHIYSMKKDGSDHKVIFNGFGWSLVVIDDWLYFSGNQGSVIDGSYTIFRMKFDGSQVENINNQYSYGMFLYGEYLYYLRTASGSQDVMSVCRSALDGTNEEVLFPNGYLPLIIEDKLYYRDNQGNLFRTKPDGTEPLLLPTTKIKTYAISGKKIIYHDIDDNIYSCDLDGANNVLLRNSQGSPIHCINVYNGRIFFAEYDTNFNYTAYGYNYTVHSCDMNGNDEREVFSSVSYGIYMNIVNNKLMLMDYARFSTTDQLSAVVSSMDLDGSNVQQLAR